jgi:predicted transposase/invertase (TIGR01784 family)
MAKFMANDEPDAVDAPFYQFNLSDNILFLSVMKVEKAFRHVLSIIMDKDIVELKTYNVESVVLNKEGKRAIRLDTWATDSDGIQYNVEMQNDNNDDLPKRSRFNQSLLDTPVLKAGQRTKYRNLPETYIIFITQRDLFGMDRACYRFCQICEDMHELHLKDGTHRYFLNMESLNGDPVLVSLLQYMKDTTLENPHICIQDPRIRELDEIVDEVLQSDEWEVLTMGFFETCEQLGVEKGMKEGIQWGLERGRLISLIELILSKYQKAYPEEVIAEHTEMTPDFVRSVILLHTEHPALDAAALSELISKSDS